MKNQAICILLAVLISGCATTRKSVGVAMAGAGSGTGKTGNVVLAASGAFPLLIPAGVVAWIPMRVTAVILYYPGCLISGEEPESDAFDL